MVEQTIDIQNLATTTISAQTHEPTRTLLRDSVELAVRNFLSQLQPEHDIEEFYAMVMAEVEAPLFDVVMQYSRGNQKKA